jgi:hypothetical protein
MLAYERGTHYRRVHAALHLLANAVELSTPFTEGWCVDIDAIDDIRGRLRLELLRAIETEAARGMALLRKVVG